MKLDCHVSMFVPNYVLRSVKGTISHGTNAFTLYTGTPQNTRHKAVHELKIEEAYSLIKEHGINEGSMVMHAPYIINPANCVREETFTLGMGFLQKEIARVQALHAVALVLHPGSHVKAGEKGGLRKIVEDLDLAMWDVQDVQISIGTMTGKDGEIGYSFAYVRYLMDHTKYGGRLHVCLDTCRIHDTGCNLSDFGKVLDESNAVIDLERLACMHINDSKSVQGTRGNRRANIGLGEISLERLNTVVRNERVRDIVKILETPYVEDHPPYRQEIAMPRSGMFDEQIMEETKGNI